MTEPAPSAPTDPTVVPPAEPPPPPRRTDRPWALAVVLVFTLSLGIGPLALPLLALANGYDAVAIGLLTATAAGAHFGFRLALPALLGRVTDRSLIAVSCLLLAGSYGLLVVSAALPVFVVAELLLGGARGLFWTASQTHAVRTRGDPVSLLAQVGVVGNIGTMIGPFVTGIVATRSIELALGMGFVIAVAGAALCLRLDRITPYQRQRRHGEPRMWRRPGVDVACWSSFAAGGWRSLVSSYVPVVLTSAGIAPSAIGLMLSAADGAATITIGLMARMPAPRLRAALTVSVVVMALGLAVLPIVAGSAVLAGIAVVISGAGSGPLTILGAAVAREEVAPDQEGDALALVGTFRAAAMLVVPAGVAVTLSVLTVGAALAVAAVAIAVPGTVVGLHRRR